MAAVYTNGVSTVCIYTATNFWSTSMAGIPDMQQGVIPFSSTDDGVSIVICTTASQDSTLCGGIQSCGVSGVT